MLASLFAAEATTRLATACMTLAVACDTLAPACTTPEVRDVDGTDDAGTPPGSSTGSGKVGKLAGSMTELVD